MLAPKTSAADGAAAFVAVSPMPHPAQPHRQLHLVRQPASAVGMKRRHRFLAASFLLAVVLPVLVCGWYLWARAADQYSSTVAFSVHQENTSSAASLLGGISSISGSSSADTDILYEYIFSQQLVAEIDAEIGLSAIWSKPAGDPVFAYAPDGTIEDLVDYWNRMVTVQYNAATRLIEVRVLAFSPDESRLIATAIFDKSNAMINRLNDVATADAIRYTAEELEKVKADLVIARQAMTEFRNSHQFVDPSADLASQTGILAGLEQQLSATLVELDMLRVGASPKDPRIEPMELRVKVIEDRIAAERLKLGLGADGGTGEVLATLVSDYERLAIEREFAESAYRAARAAHEAAQTDARRQSRYLAPHVAPTLAQSARFPERGHLFFGIAIFLFMLWGISALLFYSLRDRR